MLRWNLLHVRKETSQLKKKLQLKPVNDTRRVEEMEQELAKIRQENNELREKLAMIERQLETIYSWLFCLDRQKLDTDINFYTVFPNYATFLAMFEFLNPGVEGEDIRPRSSLTDVLENFYHGDSDEDCVPNAKKGHPGKLKPIEEFFIVLCHLRRGFSGCHLPNPYGMAQSTISKIFVPWIRFMFLKFGQLCMLPSKSVLRVG